MINPVDIAVGAMMIARHDAGLPPQADLHLSNYPLSLHCALMPTASFRKSIEHLKNSETIKSAITFKSELEPSWCTRNDVSNLPVDCELHIQKVRQWTGMQANLPPPPEAAEGGVPLTATQSPKPLSDGPIFIVGPSGSGKTTLTRNLNLFGYTVHEADTWIFANDSDNSYQISEYGTERFLDLAGKAIPWSDLGSNDIVDLGALFLLSPQVRRDIRQRAGSVIALSAPDDVLMARTFITTHDIGRHHERDEILFKQVMWLRNVLAFSVADCIIDTSGTEQEALSMLSSSLEKTRKRRSSITYTEPYPEYEPQDYYLGSSRIINEVFKKSTVSFSKGIDIGSGTGRNTLFLACAMPELEMIAIDPSPSGISRTQQRARFAGCGPRVITFLGSIETFLKKKLSTEFDIVLLLTTPSHLEKNALNNIFSELSNNLASDGLIIASAFLSNDPGANSDCGMTASETSKYVTSWFSPGELPELFPKELQLLHFAEYTFTDTGHGEPHQHSVSECILSK